MSNRLSNMKRKKNCDIPNTNVVSIKEMFAFLKKLPFLHFFHSLFDRPGLAMPVLQTVLSLIN